MLVPSILNKCNIIRKIVKPRSCTIRGPTTDRLYLPIYTGVFFKSDHADSGISRTIPLGSPNAWTNSRMERYRGRVAVVTGGSEGIGAATVRRLVESGMKVAALARREGILKELELDVSKNSKDGIIKSYVCDVKSDNEVIETFNKIEKDLGPISVLVNNAGVLRNIDLMDIDLSHAKHMLDTNVMAVLNCIKASMDSIKRNSLQDGHIVIISSIAGHRLPPYTSYGAYSSTKFAVNTIVKSLKIRLAEEQSTTRVTSICPGLVRTPMTENRIIDEQLKIYLQPEDVADTVIYAISAPPTVNITDMVIQGI